VTEPVRPDVVVVICDDLGWGDLPIYAPSPIRTPHLDSLAEKGTVFTAMYSGGPTCTPARAALLTGRAARRTGAGTVVFPGDDAGLDLHEQTLGGHLTSLGYASHCVGKWHLGPVETRGPRRFGFASYLGLPYSNDMEPLRLYEDDRVVEDPTDVSALTELYTCRAERVLAEAAGDQPVFLYLAHTMPHHPVSPGAAHLGRSAAGKYGDAVEEIDDSLGRVMAAVEQRRRDTVVVFTSDHGPWWNGCTGGLRDRKFSTYEGGVRVPFVTHWPGCSKPSSRCDQPRATVDVLPTLLAQLDAPASTRPVDGRNLFADEPEREIPLFDGGGQLNAVRAGRWKLHRRRHGWRGEVHEQLALPQLFDLTADPCESYDVADRHPQVVARLLRSLEAADARCR
jgi:uncharacterized sulfatase